MPPPARRAPATVALLVAALAATTAAAGCDTDDGRALRDPPPGATAPTQPPSSVASTEPAGPSVSTPAVGIALTSPAFAPGAAIPERFGCDGVEISPPLSWQGIPLGVAEVGIVVRDFDAPSGPFVHWVVTGIDPIVTGFAEGGLPETAVEVVPWTGPCPPAGETHDYVFELFVLPQPSGVVAETDPAAAISAVEAGFTLSTQLIATFDRPA